MKDRVGQVVGRAQHRFREPQRRAVRRHAVDAKGTQDPDQNAFVRRLVQADPHAVMADLAEIQPLGPRGGQDARLAHADLDRDRVEQGARSNLCFRRL